MASKRRNFCSGEYYHVFDRGNHRENIFHDRRDRYHFLSKLDEYSERDDISVIAYCLMTNHYHLLLRQNGETPISHLMQSLKASFVTVHNAKYGIEGRLFQDRFGMRRIINNEDLLSVSRYIHRNPDVFDDYRKYQWSSIREYISGRNGICDVEILLELLPGREGSYNTFLTEAASPGEPVLIG